MSFEQTRFSIMALPQSVDVNGVLSLNIVFIPRNINPLVEVNTNYGVGNLFIDVKPKSNSTLQRARGFAHGATAV